MENIKEKFQLEIENKNTSECILKGVVPISEIEKIKSDVIEDLKKSEKVDGFRDGKVSDEVFISKVGELPILENCAKTIISHLLPEMIATFKINPISQPKLSINSIATNSPISFSLLFITLPEVNLGNYKEHLSSVQKMGEVPEVKDEEVESILINLRKNLFKKLNKDAKLPEDNSLLPQLTPEYIKEVSMQYSNIDELKKGLIESMKREKEATTIMNHRQSILNTLIEKIEINIPDVLANEEAERAFEGFKKQIESLGSNMDDYFKQQKITKEQMQEKMKKEATTRAKTQILLNEIAIKENIIISPDEMKKEVDRFKEKFKDMSDEQVRIYVKSLLQNEKVMDILAGVVASRLN